MHCYPRRNILRAGLAGVRQRDRRRAPRDCRRHVPLIDSSFTPDAAAGLMMDGTKEDLPFIPKFPYLAVPYEGYEHSHDA